MITLTQEIKRLALHAHFEAVCKLPVATQSITHLCTLIRDTDPEFFSNNGAFENYYGDEYADYSDFDLMVQALKDMHTQTLLVDETPSFYAALSHFGVPELSCETNWGDSVSQLLDALLNYSQNPTAYSSPDSVADNVDCDQIVDAEFVEAV